MDKVPSTPPPTARYALETPSTPLLPQPGLFPTPQTLKAHSKRVLSGEILPAAETHHSLLGTPETTPRKRQTDSGKAVHHVLFPITHSTVGTGRRYSNNFNQGLLQGQSQGHAGWAAGRTTGLLDLKSSIKIEIEEDAEEEDETTVNEDLEEELMNYSSSDEAPKIDIKRKLELKTPPMGPCTPPNQIIDDDFIMNMNVETCHDSDDLEDVKNDINMSTPNLTNPFLHTGHDQASAEANPRFANEIEMIYHSTGEHFWVPQDAMGLDIKPTNLFGKLRSVEDSPLKLREFDMSNLLRTPKLQQDMSLMEDINSTDEDETECVAELEVPVRQRSKSNPFNPSQSQPQPPQLPQRPRKLGVLRRVEYINQSSGDKREIELSEDEIIKPKRLNFSGY